jgi:C-terminal processing protease CtpA/Prc
VVIEGRGVIPNIEVPLKRSDLLQGKDSQIEAAITHLQTMRSRANSDAQP